ncbi:MAG: aldehyde ferredoxin oxidoreductase C-terminal domain-containing protein [Actinomycetota bacterium]|nr:aldehyde ferredoxin oxidoreductase C-terminal domain-containing protein [Actinomycetota bacterium]
MHVKGMELPFHEPRIKQMLGLGYAVSPIGPYYTVVEHDTDFDFNAEQLFMDKVAPLTVYDRLKADSLSHQKVRMFFLLQPAFSMLDALCACIFAFSPVRFFDFQYLVDIVNAVTGWESSLFELIKIGEKRINMYRLFALRENSTEDMLPERIFEPIENGPLEGLKDRQASSLWKPDSSTTSLPDGTMKENLLTINCWNWVLLILSKNKRIYWINLQVLKE